MTSQDFRLIFGVVIWVGIYAIGNYTFQRHQGDSAQIGASDAAALERGRTLVENCTACHYIDQRANFVGPHLVDVVGRSSADVDNFSYSPALKRLQLRWTHDNLVKFLQAPQQFAPGTKMTVSGWSPEDSVAIVKYLEARQ